MATEDRLVQGHSAYIYERGGQNRVGQVLGMSLVRWTRMRDDISEATVYVPVKYAQPQRELLEIIEPIRHELVLFRGEERVWEGPIDRIDFTKGQVEIHAKDVLYYLKKTALRQRYSSAYPNVQEVTTRIEEIIANESWRWEQIDPPVNIMPHLTIHHTPGEARTTKVTEPYEMTVWEHLDDLAQHNGIDYTVVGRAIHIWDVSMPIGQTPTTTENDYLGDLHVTYYGAELAAIAHVADGHGTVGTAYVDDPNWDYYGPVEIVSSAYGDDEDEVPQEIVDSQAQRNLSGRFPVPMQVRVPDNSSINMRGVLTPAMLVPGTYIPLMVTLAIREVTQMQKLHSVKFEETGDGETVAVTMLPASKPDEAEEE